MTLRATVAELVREFRASGRIVIVGASLAGLRAAETLREEGFTGSLTIIGDEPYEPYDRPPLSKQVLKGWVPADHMKLPRMREVDADWRLGVAAVGLDRVTKQVSLADGEQVPYDRLLIGTGTRARQWPNPAEAALIRSRDDAERLQKALAELPSRVLVIGAGFIGSEVASVCRELDTSSSAYRGGPRHQDTRRGRPSGRWHRSSAAPPVPRTSAPPALIGGAGSARRGERRHHATSAGRRPANGPPRASCGAAVMATLASCCVLNWAGRSRTSAHSSGRQAAAEVLGQSDVRVPLEH